MTGYLSADRMVETRWQTYAQAPDVRLLSFGAETAIPTDSAGVALATTVVSGSQETDAQGTRTARLVLPAGTQVMVDGESSPRTEVTIQVKEMTNTTVSGRDAMIASLPPTSAFTYAVNVSLKGAENKSIELSQLVPVYIDNFLGMPTGEAVPVGYYDTARQQWVASENGRVIKIVSVNASGEAELDTDATVGPNSPADLAALGITHSERVKLAGAPYGIGTSLWRFQTNHFSTWDANWGWGPPGPLPNNPTPTPPPPPCGGSTAVGSLIDCEGQALRESFAVAGTPFSLYYASTRQQGGEKPLRIPLTADTLPADLKSVKLEINVAGKRFTQEDSSPVANLSYDFHWDGRDAAGRMLIGAQPISTRIGFHYTGTYRRTASFGANGQGVAVAQSNDRFDATLWQFWSGYIEHWNAQQAGLGGWDFDVHHGYDPLSGTLHRGDGRDELVPSSLTAFRKLPLTPHPIPQYNALTVGPDGSLYFVEGGPPIKIKRLAPNNSITLIAGGGSASTYPYGDGGPALSATLQSTFCLAMGPNQKLYVCESGYTSGRVRVIDLAGSPPTISTFAGGGTATPPAAGQSAVPTSVHLDSPFAIGVAVDGGVFIADKGLRQIYRVRDQQLTVFATRPLGTTITAMAVGKDGSVYINNAPYYYNILKYDVSGALTELTRPGADNGCPANDEGPAATTCLEDPTSLAVGPDGLLYISDGIGYKVKRIGPTGNIETVLGTGTNGNGRDGLAGRQTAIGAAQALAIAPDGTLYVSDIGAGEIRYSKPSVARSFPAVVPSADGSELFKFDSNGHHSETLDAHTGILRYAFRYNASGYLSGISDRALSDPDRHELTITRSSIEDGTQIDLTAPFGQRTRLVVDSGNKMLKQATDPESGVYQFEYFSGGGLMKQMWDPKNVVAQDPSPYKFEFVSGLLSKDTDPLGHSQSLTQAAIANGWRVTRYDQLNRATTYDTKSLDPLHSASAITGPDSLTIERGSYLDGRQSDIAPDGNRYSGHQVSPDGSSAFFQSDSDPALGLRAPVTSSTVEFMGSATDVRRTTSRNRSITLANPNDLTSVQTFTETQNVNGRAQPSKVEYNASTLKFTTTSSAGRQTFRTIDSLGRTVSFRIGTLPETTFSYDDTDTRTGKVSSEVRKDDFIQLEKKYSYFGSGVTKMGGYPSTVSYLRKSLAQTSSSPLQDRSTSFSTDAFGRVLLETTNSEAIGYSWDENGNLSTIDPPGASQHTQIHSLLDQLLTYEPPSLPPAVPPTPVNTSYTYTPDRKLESVTDPDGVVTTWTYDANIGKLTAIGNSSFDYFSRLETAAGQAPGRLKSITGPYDVDLSFNYLGRLTTSSKWTKSPSHTLIGSVGWSYNNDFARVAETITDSAGASRDIKFDYGDADGFLTCASLNTCSPPSPDSLSVTHDSVNGLLASVNFGSLTESYGYDHFGQLASKTAKFGATTLLLNEYDDLGTNLTHRRDALGRILRRKQTLGTTTPVTFDYTYSPEGRLTDVLKDGVTYEHYDYSTQNGNRSAATTPTLSVLASEVSYDAQDRLKTYGPYTYAYTNNGNLRTKTDTRATPAAVTTYVYDALGNLLSVSPPTGSVISYIVDGQNRRIAKKVGSSTVKQWLYRDSLKPVAELDGAGNLVSIFVYGSNPNTPDLVVRNNVTYRILTDHVGSVLRAINVSNAGDVAFAAEYTAFGEQTVTAGSADFVPFGFAGGLYDGQTGLVRFGARDYDPVVGRWMSKDPILFDGGQANLYVYVGNDPVNFVDPNGRQTIPFPWWGPIVGGAAAGAGIGSAVGGVGAIPGAIVGAILGAAIVSVPGDTAAPTPDCRLARTQCTQGCLPELESDKDCGGNNGFQKCIELCLRALGC
ncbi:MAG TPA: RHS repeat-associated core domain-containing protein [Polyangiaceae bacterium]|nr:RHS repeat-associated core domain-containing protein [Polyangiaceae bacterium]